MTRTPQRRDLPMAAWIKRNNAREAMSDVTAKRKRVRYPLLVEWSKVERLLDVGNRLADALDADSTQALVAEWDRARCALAREQEEFRLSEAAKR